MRLEHEVATERTREEALATLQPLLERLGLSPVFRCASCGMAAEDVLSAACERCGGAVAALYTSGVTRPRLHATASELPLLLCLSWAPGCLSVAAQAWTDRAAKDLGAYLRFLATTIEGTLSGEMSRAAVTSRLAEMRRQEKNARDERREQDRRVGMAVGVVLALGLAAGYAVFR